MSDADIARQSNDGDGFVIIAGEGNASLDIEVQEDIVAKKVGSDEGSPVKEKVNLDDLADILNGAEGDGEPAENGVEAEPEGDPVAEEEIAEIKVGGVEAGLSIHWPADDETDKTEEKEETQEEEEKAEEEEMVVIETPEEERAELETPEEERAELEIPEEETAELEIAKEEETAKEEEQTEEKGEQHEEEQETELEQNVTIEENDDLVNISIKSKDEETDNVAIELTLGEKREEVVDQEEETEPEVDQDKVSHVVRPAQGGSLRLSDRIRVFEKKDKEEYILANAGDKAIDEIAATEAQTTESTPVIRDDIVRSYDQVEEEKSLPGGTRSIREQFSKGVVSNVEIKRTIDTEPVNVKSLDDYQPPQDEEDEEVHIKPQDIVRSDRDEGQTAESQPQEVAEGVVKAHEEAEEVRAAAGLKNLKSMFEKGGVSNIETRVERERIEVKALGEVEEGTPQGVAENVPQERPADMMSGTTVEEDPGIKHGLAQRIKAQFEKGSVSNITEKHKPDLERTPKSLEDFSHDESNKSFSESTPLRRDDVVRSDIPLEEQSHTSEGTRSLLTRWEKGQVEHAEEKPKEVIRDSKDLKADMQVSESEPTVRDDLIRESDETDNAIPEGVTKGISQKIEGSAEFHVEVNVAEDEPKRLSEVADEEKEQAVGEEEAQAQFEINVEVNGNVTPEENGHQEENEATPNGHYQNDDESADVDPSAEIKAARAAAVEEEATVVGGGDQPDVLVESR